VVCNTGVSLIPRVNGQNHHFQCAGLYNGLVLLGDKETHSFWDHISGECIHGPLRGQTLELSGSLFYMTAKQALKAYPEARIAISRQSFFQKILSQIFQWTSLRSKGYIPSFFNKTMGKADNRSPRLDIGLGIWFETKARYYPLEQLKAHGNAIIDTVNGHRILVYIDPISKAPSAIHSTASEYHWDGETLHLNTHEVIKDSRLYDGQGSLLPMNRPNQMFARWYGFSYTFPNCDIYE
jgi:hypothetical protein